MHLKGFAWEFWVKSALNMMIIMMSTTDYILYLRADGEMKK